MLKGMQFHCLCLSFQFGESREKNAFLWFAVTLPWLGGLTMAMCVLEILGLQLCKLEFLWPNIGANIKECESANETGKLEKHVSKWD